MFYPQKTRVTRPFTYEVPSVYVPTRLHAAQKEIFNDLTRVRVAVCGRRFGKSHLGIVEALQACLCADRLKGYAGRPKNNDGEAPGLHRVVWWVASSQEQSRRIYRELNLAFRRFEKLETRECVKYRLLQFSNLSVLEFLSSGSGDHLRGAGLDFLIVDEAASVPEEIWSTVLRPALIDRDGRALILGTPRGTHNWLARIYAQGHDPYYAGQVKSFHFESLKNPKLKQRILDEHARGMTPEQIAQEFRAEFVPDAGKAFHDVRRLADSIPQARGIPGELYSTGIDLARRRDFTVLVTLCHRTDQPARMVAMKRVQASWTEQEKIIRDHLELFPGECVVDATGVGDPMYERIHEFCDRAERFTFTEKSKAELIGDLRFAFELERLRIMNVEVLLNELELYEYEQASDKKKISHYPRFSAPAGKSDDCVTALALAYRGVSRLGTPRGKDEAGVCPEKRVWRPDGIF